MIYNIAIYKAIMEDLPIVKNITTKTIKAIYPKYYPKGAVAFFLEHHNDENIKKDILDQNVYLLKKDNIVVGTITISQHEVCRLFVLPQYQKKGYGSRLLEYAEDIISKDSSYIILDSSLPAKDMYIKKQYHFVESHTLLTKNGDYLSYDVMQKKVVRISDSSYEGKVFIPKSNSVNGEVNYQTIFNYHQDETVLYADYAGGDILRGYLIGKIEKDNTLNFHYQHLNIHNEIRIGKCHSIPIVQEDGSIELHEEWQWLNLDQSKGSSILIEVKKTV